jgi:hypothetical protein
VDLVFNVGTPLNLGTRQIVPVTGGTFNGPRLKGTAVTGGGDWIQRRPDGVSMLNVRATLRTDDEQLIYITYDGILYVPTGAPATDRYWRITPKFETGSAKYEWLTRKEGQPYNVYHGTLEARPLTATTSKIAYTLFFDNLMLPDEAARAADRARRTERFMQALQNMKILAEGGKLPPAPARGGTTRGGAAAPRQ